jgi:hypothetical protein
MLNLTILNKKELSKKQTFFFKKKKKKNPTQNKVQSTITSQQNTKQPRILVKQPQVKRLCFHFLQ